MSSTLMSSGLTKKDHTSRKTLLHVTQCAVGGVSRAIRLAVEATPEINHVVLAPRVTLDDLVSTGAELRLLPNGLLARVGAVSRVARDINASAVHAHSSWAGLYTRAIHLPIPILYQPHCFSFSDPELGDVKRGAYWLAERMLAGRADAILTLTEHEVSQAQRLGAKLIIPVVNCSTISRIDLPIDQVDRTRKPFTVTMSGRISEQKDPVFFATIARRFAMDSSIRFVWLGDEGVDRPYPEGRRFLESAGVEITGWLDRSALCSVLAETSLYCHCAMYEGFPLALLDACELGVGAIIRNIDALSTIDLPRFSTPAEAASLIRKYSENSSCLSGLVEQADHLASLFSKQAHDKSVRSLYHTFGLL